MCTANSKFWLTTPDRLKSWKGKRPSQNISPNTTKHILTFNTATSIYLEVTEIADSGTFEGFNNAAWTLRASHFSISFLRRIRALLRSPWHRSSNTSSIICLIRASSSSRRLEHNMENLLSSILGPQNYKITHSC